MELPKHFNILNHTITVIVDNAYCQKNKCIGQFFPDEHKIIMSTHYKKVKRWTPYKKSLVAHAFYHELTHCILHFMNEDSLYSNEQFVDGFGGLLAQVTSSFKC